MLHDSIGDHIQSILEINNRWLERLLIFGVSVILAIGAGFVTGRLGLIIAPIAFGALGVVVVLIIGKGLWWVSLYIILYGYMFASRGFAGIGFFPLYAGEIVMLLGILTVILLPFSPRIFLANGIRPFLRFEIFVLILLLIWSALQTIPYIQTYGFDAIRDAMMYGYAVFALLVMLLIPKRWVQQFFDNFGLVLPFALLWFPALFMISRLDLLPIRFPGSSIPIIYTKGSDVAVHLAGIGAYLLLGLDQRKRLYSTSWHWVLWILLAISILFYGAIGRAAMLTALLGVGIVFLLRPRSRWDRPLLLLVTTISLMLVTNTYSTLKIDFGLHREVSVEQFVENISSIFSSGNDEAGELEGTKQFRLQWWDAIVDYTFNGEYFWTGKGYGINLAESDGFQLSAENQLRAPHNGHLTFLARSGVPGFLLWVLFLLSYALMLLRHIVLKAKSDPWEAKYAVWLLAYLAAHVLMTNFDVFIEGPMGGIWFWSLIGMGFVYFSDSEEVIFDTAIPQVNDTVNTTSTENNVNIEEL